MRLSRVHDDGFLYGCAPPFSSGCRWYSPLVQDAEDRSIAVQIQQALLSAVRLELLPKATIDVFITVIENDGIDGCIASGSVAASAALADAGIEMLGLVASCSSVRGRWFLLSIY